MGGRGGALWKVCAKTQSYENQHSCGHIEKFIKTLKCGEWRSFGYWQGNTLAMLTLFSRGMSSILILFYLKLRNNSLARQQSDGIRNKKQVHLGCRSACIQPGDASMSSTARASQHLTPKAPSRLERRLTAVRVASEPVGRLSFRGGDGYV